LLKRYIPVLYIHQVNQVNQVKPNHLLISQSFRHRIRYIR
jgi:hypothetical protein